MALPLLVLAILALWVVRKFHAATEAAIVSHVSGGDSVAVIAGHVPGGGGVKVAMGSLKLMQQVAALMSILTFVQMSGTLVQIDFSWPIEVKWASGILANLGSFDISGAAAPECSYKVSSSVRWLFKLLVPIIPLIFLGLVIMCLKIIKLPCTCCQTICSGCAGRLSSCGSCLESAVRFLSAKANLIFTLTYIVLIRAALSPWDCVGIGDGVRVMRDDPDTPCVSENIDTTGMDANYKANYKERVMYSVPTLVVCVGALVILALILVCNRHKLFTNKAFMQTYGPLYLRYNKKYYYWEILVMIRKLLLVLITRVLSNDLVTQIVGCAFVLGGALLLQLACKPFISAAVDQLEERTLAACVILVVLGAASQNGAPTIVITVLYFLLMIVAAIAVCLALVGVYTEGKEENEVAAGSSSTADTPSSGEGAASDAAGSTEAAPATLNHMDGSMLAAGKKILV
jgi:hypothetical protein